MIIILNRYTRRVKTANGAFIRFGTDGRIVFSADAVDLMKLQEGEGISFGWDSEDEGVVYVFKNASGQKLRYRQSAIRTMLCIYSRSISKEVVRFMETKEGGALFLSDQTTTFQNKQSWILKKKKS